MACGLLARMPAYSPILLYHHAYGDDGTKGWLTAMFASNHLMVMGAIRGAVKFGLTIPQDLSIIDYDDIPQPC